MCVQDMGAREKARSLKAAAAKAAGNTIDLVLVRVRIRREERKAGRGGGITEAAN